jgi:hypothetical protein
MADISILSWALPTSIAAVTLVVTIWQCCLSRGRGAAPAPLLPITAGPTTAAAAPPPLTTIADAARAFIGAAITVVAVISLVVAIISLVGATITAFTRAAAALHSAASTLTEAAETGLRKRVPS